MKKLLVLFLAFSLLLFAGCNNAAITDENESYESNEKEQETLQSEYDEKDFEKLPIALESVEVEIENPSTKISADEMFLDFAKKQSVKSDIAKKHPIVVKINSFSQFEEFVNNYKINYSTDLGTKFEESSFAKHTANYNKEFFESNSLFVTYLTAPRLCDTHTVTGFEINGNEMKVQISLIIANGLGATEERQTIMFFQQPITKVEDITKISVTQVKESILGVEQIS